MRSSPRLALLLLASASLGAAAWILLRPVPASPGPEARPSEPAPLPLGRQAVVPLSAHAAQRAAPAGTGAGTDWVELNNEATTDLVVGDLAAAVDKLERCHAAEPDNAVFRNNLVEALVRLARAEHGRGRLAEALEPLERALALGSARTDREALERLRERWLRERELGSDDWTEGSSRFELTFDTERSDILNRSHEVLEHLERSFDELLRWFGEDPFEARTPIRVLLYDPADFDRLTGLGDWAAGVFDGAVRVSVRDLSAGAGWRAVLVHELVHAFLHALAGEAVPGWLNEGLAQLLEGGPLDLARLRARVRGHEPYPLASLAGSLAAWKEPEAIQRAYAQSLLFVLYLRTTYGEEALRRMVFGARDGTSPAAAFEAWSAVPLELAFEDWKRSL